MRKPNQNSGWQWFDKPIADSAAVDDTARSFAQCFSSAAGTRVIEHLHNTILLRSLPPTASAHELFYHEGQRATVTLIMTLIARGKINPLTLER